MPRTSENIDLREAKKTIVKTLKEYGSLGYSRLLMSTELPETVLKKCLELLIRDGVVARENRIEPEYHLTSSGFFSF